MEKLISFLIGSAVVLQTAQSQGGEIGTDHMHFSLEMRAITVRFFRCDLNAWEHHYREFRHLLANLTSDYCRESPSECCLREWHEGECNFDPHLFFMAAGYPVEEYMTLTIKFILMYSPGAMHVMSNRPNCRFAPRSLEKHIIQAIIEKNADVLKQRFFWTLESYSKPHSRVRWLIDNLFYPGTILFFLLFLFLQRFFKRWQRNRDFQAYWARHLKKLELQKQRKLMAQRKAAAIPLSTLAAVTQFRKGTNDPQKSNVSYTHTSGKWPGPEDETKMKVIAHEQNNQEQELRERRKEHRIRETMSSTETQETEFTQRTSSANEDGDDFDLTMAPRKKHSIKPKSSKSHRRIHDSSQATSSDSTKKFARSATDPDLLKQQSREKRKPSAKLKDDKRLIMRTEEAFSNSAKSPDTAQSKTHNDPEHNPSVSRVNADFVERMRKPKTPNLSSEAPLIPPPNVPESKPSVPHRAYSSTSMRLGSKAALSNSQQSLVQSPSSPSRTAVATNMILGSRSNAL